MNVPSPLDGVALVLHGTEEAPNLSVTRTSYDYEKDRTLVTDSSTSLIEDLPDFQRQILRRVQWVTEQIQKDKNRHVLFILAQTRNFALQIIERKTEQFIDAQFNSDLYDMADMTRLRELSQQGRITLKTRVFRGNLITDKSVEFDPHVTNQEQFGFSSNVELDEEIVKAIATKFAHIMRETRNGAGNFIHTGKSGPHFLPNKILQNDQWRHIFGAAFCRAYGNGHVCIKTEEDDRSPFYADVLAALGANRVHPGRSQLVSCHTV